MANAIEEKSFVFATRVVRLCQLLERERREYVLSRQVLRSGTAIGALVSEAQYAQSKADFVNKMQIAIKEANETLYWLRLLRETDYIDSDQFVNLSRENREILRLLTSIINSSKKSLSR